MSFDRNWTPFVPAYTIFYPTNQFTENEARLMTCKATASSILSLSLSLLSELPPAAIFIFPRGGSEVQMRKLRDRVWEAIVSVR